MKKSVVFLFYLFGYQILIASDVYFFPGGAEQNLAERWSWAAGDVAEPERGFWIGYSINREMKKNSRIGVHINESSYPTLGELLKGVAAPYRDKSVDEAAREALERWESDSNLIIKQVAYLFYLQDQPNLSAVKICNLTSSINLKKRPLYWLGNIEKQDQSIELIMKFYQSAKPTEIREDLVAALALHQDHQLVMPLLTAIIEGDDHEDVREQAVFWLGQIEITTVSDYLRDLAESTESLNLREQAVFALGINNSETATYHLITLAKTARDRKIREKAIFWLSQKAADKSMAVLKEITYESPELELKEQAVFALSQLEDNEGIPALIEVACNHPSIKIRKKAIFWLGQSEDPRALDAIIDMLRDK